MKSRICRTLVSGSRRVIYCSESFAGRSLQPGRLPPCIGSKVTPTPRLLPKLACRSRGFARGCVSYKNHWRNRESSGVIMRELDQKYHDAAFERALERLALGEASEAERQLLDAEAAATRGASIDALLAELRASDDAARGKYPADMID